MDKSKTVFIDSDEEWNNKFRNLQAQYDTRNDEVRRPRLNALIWVGSFLVVASVAAYASLQIFFA